MMSKVAGGAGLPIAALAVVAVLGACAETKQVAMNEPPSASAALPEPALLQRGTSGEVSQVYLNPDVRWASYTKVMLDPVTVWTGPGSDMAKASPKEQKALADAFYTELHNAVAERCQMVTEPSPGTMRWHIALVDATSANPFLNTLSTYEPHVHLVDVAAGYAFNHGVAYWVGEATAEGYARDATTGALLWEGADERAGTKAFGRDTFNSWDDVDNAFKAWAEQFARRLDELGACPV
jgi:Protein of unknown function (DUF3313)